MHKQSKNWPGVQYPLKALDNMMLRNVSLSLSLSLSLPLSLSLSLCLSLSLSLSLSSLFLNVSKNYIDQVMR